MGKMSCRCSTIVNVKKEHICIKNMFFFFGKMKRKGYKMRKIRSPYYVDFSVTPYCNLKCGFCSAAALGTEHGIKRLSLNDIERIFDEFDKNDILRVSIEGGEPFLRDDIIDILELADQHIFTYYVNTNGTLITDEIAKKIAETKVSKICVSVDGPNEEIHDLSRGVKGAFKKTINAIKLLQENNVPVDAIITLNKINKDYVVETLKFLESIGIKNVAMMLLATVGKASKNMKDIYISFEEWRSLLIELTKLKKNRQLPTDLNIVPTGEGKCPWELYLPLKLDGMESDINLWLNEDRVSSLEENEFGCTAGKESFAVDGYGNVYGCSLMVSENELVAGNILEQSLADIWNKASVFEQLRKNSLFELEGGCRECELLEKCKAGCRACAFALEKSLVASDIRCPLAKRGEKKWQ